jgi:hypothetical protein
MRAANPTSEGQVGIRLYLNKSITHPRYILLCFVEIHFHIQHEGMVKDL